MLTVSTKLSRLKKLEVIVVVNLQILRMYIELIYSKLYYRGDITYYMQEVQQENALANRLKPKLLHLLPL